MVISLFGVIFLPLNKNTYPHSVPKKFYDISRIEIKYEFHDWGKIYKKDYTIERIDGKYYHQGQKIDSTLIHGIPDSFTDFYQTKKEKSQALEAILDFTVSITLKNEKVVLTTTEWKNCFIPWRIEYQENSYLQYNGRIPSAVLTLLKKIDSSWSEYEKYITWGCEPHIVPDEYVAASKNFPTSVPVLTPLESKGHSRIIWKNNTIDHIGAPAYSNGVVYTITDTSILALDAHTGNCIWEYESDREPTENNIQGCLQDGNNHVYAALPPYTVYKLTSDGKLLWKTAISTRDHTTLKVIQKSNKVLVYEPWGEGVFCLDTTGRIIWSIPHTIEAVTVSRNEVFVEAHNKNRFYYAVVNIHTGKTIWDALQHNIINPVYDNGVLYYSADGKFIAENIHTQKELWSYTYAATPEQDEDFSNYLLGQKIHENKIFLLIPAWEDKKFYVDMVLFTKKGVITKKYTLKETYIEENYMPKIEIVSDKIYFLTRNGYIEKFNTNNGQKVWETEIRGPEIATFQSHENRIYVSDSESIYCINTHGTIEWVFNIRKEFDHTMPVSFVYVSDITDGLIVVSTSQGVCVLDIT